jgi:hypothetical protein
LLYRFLADGVVIVHLGFVAFVVFGALLAFRWPAAALAHLPAACWGAYVEFSGKICPLTPLENWLRVKAGGRAYEQSFIEEYLIPVLYPANLTANTQILLGSLVVLINCALYGLLLSRWRHTSEDP